MCFVSFGKLRTRGLVIIHSSSELNLAESLCQQLYFFFLLGSVLVPVTIFNPNIKTVLAGTLLPYLGLSSSLQVFLGEEERERWKSSWRVTWREKRVKRGMNGKLC